MSHRFQVWGKDLISDAGSSGTFAFLAKFVLRGFALCYSMGLHVYLDLEKFGFRRRSRVPIPVISIGNLTVGGTGKTPMVQWLCRRLSENGKRSCVLTRGHGGSAKKVCVVSNGRSKVIMKPDVAGDEPVMLAASLPGIPVLVGKDRRLSAREALRQFGSDVLILDDGFQYWQLHRDIDIVLLDAKKPFDNGYPLPRGLLREPRSHLRRADIVVITRSESLESDAQECIKAQIIDLAPHAEIYFAQHCPGGLVAMDSLEVESPLTLQGRSVFAICGIAQPDSFHNQLIVLGAKIVGSIVLTDHSEINIKIVERAERLAVGANADIIVMTEKDWVKWPKLTLSIPTYALQVEMNIRDGHNLMNFILKQIFGNMP